MKWVNHEIVSGAAMYAMSHDLVSTGLVMAGSIFPDWIEGRPTIFNYRSWQKNHRGISHWLLMYFVIFAILAVYGEYQNSPWSQYAIFFVFGAILHVLEDAICGKVPFICLKHKMGIKLFYVGTIQEYAISAGILFLLYLINYFQKEFFL